jgi:uridine phosphorylase
VPARLRPTAPTAADAILVGDPGRALLLAQTLLTQPKMSNHARGLWGYSGRTPGGHELTIQATGMGGPSAAVVLTDLAELGVRRGIRVGTCTALRGPLGPGDLVVATAAHSLPGPDAEVPPALPDPRLTRALAERLGDSAQTWPVVSLDSLHRGGVDEPPPQGDVADMQTAALFSRAGELGLALAAVLIVSEAGTQALDEARLESAAKSVGAAASFVFSA